MQIDLSSRVALVTGSTRGIGSAIARELAASGARVAVVGRDLARAQAAAEELSGAGGGQARGFACDVADVASVNALVSDVEKSFGSLDILVNNAGLTRDNLLLRISDEDWDAVIDANLRGAFATIRAATRGMMKRRWGRIVNIASIVGLTKSVAKEYASRNILANVVAPGLIETDMAAAMTEEARSAMSAAIPLGRMGSPADIAGVVTFLASDHASYITGQVLVVDGGMVM